MGKRSTYGSIYYSFQFLPISDGDCSVEVGLRTLLRATFEATFFIGSTFPRLRSRHCEKEKQTYRPFAASFRESL